MWCTNEHTISVREVPGWTWDSEKARSNRRKHGVSFADAVIALKDPLDWFRSQVEAAGGGNYQTLINSALRNFIREVISEIAEDRAGYGREMVIDEFGPMTAAARARWARAKRKPGRPRRGKGAKG